MADEVTPDGGQDPPPVAPPGGGWDAPPPQPGTGWDPYAAPPPPPGAGWGAPPPPGSGWGAPPGPPRRGWGPQYQGQGPGGWPSPPYQDPYGTGYGRPGPPETEKLSVWSLVLGIGSFMVLPVIAAVAAIITGTKGKKAIRNSGGTKTGSGMATAGQALGVINIVLAVLAGVLIAIGVNFVSHHKSYTSLQAGDCFNKAGVGSLVTTVSCASPHQQEAVGTFEYQADSSTGWPGPSGFAGAARDQCGTMAVAYLGSADAGLQLVYVYPNQQSWDNGTRKVVCSVRRRDGRKRVGSVKSGLGPSTSG